MPSAARLRELQEELDKKMKKRNKIQRKINVEILESTRSRMNMSQEKFAEYIGISASSYDLLLRDAKCGIRVAHRIQNCGAFSLDIFND